jgi:hypothetical protein
MTPPAAGAAAAPAIRPPRTVARPKRGPAHPPAMPRRRSGPAGRAGLANPTRNPARAVGIAEAVATHRLLDRLISGRIWIGVIAFALIGIVTMQLGLLKLNAGIGRSLEREALLQRENATLSAENSEMAAGERVEAQAEHAGMESIPSGALRFLAARPSLDVHRAASALSTPVATATGEASASSATTATAETLTPSVTTATTEAATPPATVPTEESAASSATVPPEESATSPATAPTEEVATSSAPTTVETTPQG